MKVVRFSYLSALGLALICTPAWSAVEFFGTAKVKPTYYSNFDFDDDKSDAPIINEAGQTKGEHIRSEVRLGWKASGEKWKIKMIAEGDLVMEKDNVDRSFYIGAEKKDSPNTGGEFGIERAEFLYTFLPQLELQAGWDIRALDIKTGGLLFGDDHPFLGFRGKLAENTGYEMLYLPVQNNTSFFGEAGPNDPLDSSSSVDGDWRVYTLKLTHGLGGEESSMDLSPILAYSDNRAHDADVYYYGLESTGKFGILSPSFEVLFADGEFGDGTDISSMAAYAGVKANLNMAFNPYVALRYTQGDDDDTDNDVEGWVGITDIGRFTPLMGMDGNILGEDLGQSYGATLYSYSPERSLGSNRYGGISNGGSGDNPGQKLVAVGASGDLSAVMPDTVYKAQAFMIWYDDTANLTNNRNPGEEVDDYAGTTFDLQLMWAASKHFSVDYIFSTFVPCDGIEDQFGDDSAFAHTLTLAWAY